MRKLTLEDAEYIAHSLASELMSFDEPMPPFATRYSGRLESCLMTPFQTFDGKILYLRLTRKAAVLFYGVIKSHPFVNGNKRMAVTLTLIFLYFNGKWIDASPYELYEVACNVAASDPRERDSQIDQMVRYLNKHLVNRSR